MLKDAGGVEEVNKWLDGMADWLRLFRHAIPRHWVAEIFLRVEVLVHAVDLLSKVRILLVRVAIGAKALPHLLRNLSRVFPRKVIQQHTIMMT